MKQDLKFTFLYLVLVSLEIYSVLLKKEVKWEGFLCSQLKTLKKMASFSKKFKEYKHKSNLILYTKNKH